MTTRAEQREQTRQRIVEAAVEAFAANGFDGSGTRDIAARAGVTQGLIAYHFASKDELWRAAADRLFGELGRAMPFRDQPSNGSLDAERAREAIRTYVRFGAGHPELFHFVVDAGRADDDRMRWLVNTHMAPWFAEVSRLAGATGAHLAAHVHYALVGASSLMFAVAPECRALAGVDPFAEEAIERHAELVARLFVP